MFHEYALDPLIMTNWDDCRFITSQFGIPKGRMISQYPGRNWFKTILQNINSLGDQDKKKIKNALEKIKKERSFSAFRDCWDNGKDWNKNVTEQHEERPFRAIISNVNKYDVNELILLADLDDEHPLFKVNTSTRVDRNVDDLTNAIHPFLIYSKDFKFIDPYFGDFFGKFQTVGGGGTISLSLRHT